MAYLFAHFISEQKDGEQVYFSVSKDGLHFTDLNEGFPVLKSEIGEKGARDPFLVRDQSNDKFYLIATDLRIEKGLGWQHAITNGSRDMLVWESKDLIYWGEPWKVTLAPEDAGNLWAPEVIYDREAESFLVFWASQVDGKHDMYYAHTSDFRNFSEPAKFLEKTMDVIDSTIAYSDGMYYRFTKSEENSRVFMDKSSSLLGEYTEVTSEYLADLEGVEGPEIYLLPDGETWALILDHFKAGTGYGIAVTKDLASGEFKALDASEYDMGETIKRHGGVLQITDEEYDRLLKYYKQNNPILPDLHADPDIVAFNNKYYIYPTTDGFTNWSGHTFSVFESEDLQTFENKGQILDLASDQVAWTTGNAWAPCCTEKDGRYYYYFTGKGESGQSGIGVAVSDHPTGPFKAMDEPILSPSLVEREDLRLSSVIDPSIYEEDGVYYLLFGNGYSGVIVELNDDMVSVKEETMRLIEGMVDFREAVTVLKRGGLYHFTWSCDDTRSENYHVNYGTSKSLYGPIDYHYPILEKIPERNIFGTGHHSILKVPNEDTYYIAYHRFGLPLENFENKDEHGYNRATCLSPLDFDEKGYMRKVIQ
ncbi:family 43 glycosylhydrolase [Fundicoccus sp. Sow4_H7]|uniref:family 43 glycosylhydrolase n=1 Tax=Fundicoccus sp. Sow4_H7 TaxID=3438784 RepID=UPI003F90B9E3